MNLVKKAIIVMCNKVQYYLRMIKELSELEIRQILQNEHYGHLGCCTHDAKPYVVPITYVYHNKKLYAYSRTGTKVTMMREQPSVCVQVENLLSSTSWESVQVWGRYRELSGEERAEAFSLLTERFWEAFNRRISIYFPFRNPDADLNEQNMILFAIDIEDMAGRTEHYDA